MSGGQQDVRKRWHKPFLRTMSQREVDSAVVLSACSGYSCGTKHTRML
ncbi:MAG: hypothetical protein ACLSVG_08835 [Clostridia bacterium]